MMLMGQQREKSTSRPCTCFWKRSRNQSITPAPHTYAYCTVYTPRVYSSSLLCLQPSQRTSTPYTMLLLRILALAPIPPMIYFYRLRSALRCRNKQNSAPLEEPAFKNPYLFRKTLVAWSQKLLTTPLHAHDLVVPSGGHYKRPIVLAFNEAFAHGPVE
ncbi:hypothetical protein BD779DRAFT_261518 [Infundibulicybe gibba]|nr:hypothetical protein BD779DRAFT_261518 [Infundibulicybe gibba]